MKHSRRRKQLTETLFGIAPAFSFRMNLTLRAMLKKKIVEALTVTHCTEFNVP